MRRLALFIVLAFSCEGPTTWSGIGDDRQCSAFGEDGIAICISQGQEYTCISHGTGECHAGTGSIACTASGDARRVLRQHEEQREERRQRDLQSQQSTMP